MIVFVVKFFWFVYVTGMLWLFVYNRKRWMWCVCLRYCLQWEFRRVSELTRKSRKNRVEKKIGASHSPCMSKSRADLSFPLTTNVKQNGKWDYLQVESWIIGYVENVNRKTLRVQVFVGNVQSHNIPKKVLSMIRRTQIFIEKMPQTSMKRPSLHGRIVITGLAINATNRSSI